MANESKPLNEKRKKGIRSFISLKADPERSEEIGNSLSKFSFVEDVLLLTGDFDFMVKAWFKDYEHLKKFLTIELGKIEGVKDPTSMMVVSAYKERNQFLKADKPDDEEIRE